MGQNIKDIMIALDKVLVATVWVNSERAIVSLAEELGRGDVPRGIEDLNRAALTGAYVSLQIRGDNFDIAAESMDTESLAQSVKAMVFAEAKKILTAGITDKKVVAA